ncbi:prohibitin family protein [Paracoccus sp. DMF-8]|uniref:SPFH domain-containing protein n=1 Tax=Paracoccus sp. DMF-8 TaxID=3019445 RepID=UPI0023E8B1A2|nr:prohibitin family protein [Paracoccus sp. DMF-8]MDF3606100.1 prohibitin family protein [Paracoccus sp. DMF-8]
MRYQMVGFPQIVGATAVICAVIGIGGLFGSYYTVDEGDRGVVVKLGVVKGTSEPGIHFKAPFVTSVYHIPVRNQIKSYEGLEAYTTDQQIATIEGISISYRIPTDRVEDVYREYRTPDAVVDRFVGRRVNAELEKVFGQYSAERSVRERSALSADVSNALKKLPDGAPIEILSVELTSIAYSEEYSRKINERMGAEVEVARKMQEVRQADQDRQAAQHQADARAYEIKANADAQAHSIRVKGEAEAEAIRLRSTALANNPALIELTKAEKWDGVLPTSMPPQSTVPFLNVK